MRRFQEQAGFTLIETLLYAFFVSLIVGGALGAAYSIIQNSDHMNAQVAAQEDATFVTRKIIWAFNGATSVSTTPATLTVHRASAPTTVVFDMNSSSLRIKKDAAAPVFLTGIGSTISSVSFTHLTSPEGVMTAFFVNGQQFTLTTYLHP